MDTPHPPMQNLRPPPPEPTFENDAVISSNSTLEIATTSAMSTATDGPKSTTIRKRRKKEKSNFPDPHALSSSASSSSPTASFSYSSAQKRGGIRLFSRRRNPNVFSGPGRLNLQDVEALALPLGMSIAAVVAQVLERKGGTEEKILLDHLSQICASAVKESLVNVFGDKFDCFVENFEKSFRSTLRTLRLISKSAKAKGGENKRAEISSEVTFSFNRSENCARDIEEYWSESLPQASSRDERPSTHEDIEETTRIDFVNQQLILHDRQIMQRLAVVSPVQSLSALDSANNQAILTTFKKSVQEQKRSNDLKTFELGLTLKRMEQKEREMALKSDANFLDRCKLSFGFSKVSFQVGKFKTQLEDTRHAELLRKCIDCLVAGLFIMLGCLGYGVFIYSHKRISEATSSCTPMESRSWWIPKPMASFNSGLQILKCQFQVLTRMLAGGIMVFVIAYLLLQRSAASNQTLPVTFILLLLGVVCGFAGKLCIDTLGGSGICWLFFWEILCLIHLFSNLWTSVLFVVLHGPVTATEKTRSDPVVPYWLRRCLFYTTTFLFLPVSCGFLPFASLREWTNHFASLIVDPSLIKD